MLLGQQNNFLEAEQVPEVPSSQPSVMEIRSTQSRDSIGDGPPDLPIPTPINKSGLHESRDEDDDEQARAGFGFANLVSHQRDKSSSGGKKPSDAYNRLFGEPRNEQPPIKQDPYNGRFDIGDVKELEPPVARPPADPNAESTGLTPAVRALFPGAAAAFPQSIEIESSSEEEGLDMFRQAAAQSSAAAAAGVQVPAAAAEAVGPVPTVEPPKVDVHTFSFHA